MNSNKGQIKRLPIDGASTILYNFTMKTKKWTEEQLLIAAASSTSVRQVLSKLNLKEAGGNYSQLKKYLQLYNVDITHFRGKAWNKGLKGLGKPIYSLEEILVSDSSFQSYKLKKRLFDASLKKQICEECGWAQISEDGRIPLELDHTNGDSRDNRLENLRVLCPNCHSLKPTHRGRNRKIKIGPVVK